MGQGIAGRPIIVMTGSIPVGHGNRSTDILLDAIARQRRPSR
jgi:hypothetical protein